MSAYVTIGETGPETGVPESIDGVNPFEAPGEWLRCALHTHSTVSDGTLSPEYLVMAYEEQGFDVVAITDHWRLTQVPSTERVLTIPAAELGWDIEHPHYPRQSAEFLVYGIDHIPDDPGGDRANWYTNDEENYEVRTFPDLTAGAPTDAGNGRLIPTTAVEQYAATMASWMGVGASDLRLILPNLPNFATDTLGFMS